MSGRIRPNTFMTPNEHVDEAMEMLTEEIETSTESTEGGEE